MNSQEIHEADSAALTKAFKLKKPVIYRRLGVVAHPENGDLYICIEGETEIIMVDYIDDFKTKFDMYYEHCKTLDQQKHARTN